MCNLFSIFDFAVRKRLDSLPVPAHAHLHVHSDSLAISPQIFELMITHLESVTMGFALLPTHACFLVRQCRNDTAQKCRQGV